MRVKVYICLLLATVTAAIYWPAGFFGIVYFDDTGFVRDNPMINGGLTWDSLWWSLTGVVMCNWHPVTNFSFVLMHQFFGFNPPAEHWVNIFFHAANAVLLFLVLNRLTGSIWRGAMVAALFAWHPLRVESVAWISERKDVLCGFFYLLAIFCYARTAPNSEADGKKRGRGVLVDPLVRYRWVLLFFLLALMSKPMAVTLPVLLLLLDFWPLKRLVMDGKTLAKSPAAIKDVLFEKWPFMILAVGTSVLTFELQKQTGAMVLWHQRSFGEVIATVISGYIGYLGKFFWPTNLSAMYVLGKITDSAGIWLGGLLLLAITTLCVIERRRRPYLLMGWLWYLIACAPIIGIVQVGIQSMADRYTYLPLIGPAIGLVWLAAEWATGFSARKLFIGGAGAALAALVMMSRVQAGYWHDTVSLFEHAVEVTPSDNYAAHYTLGTGLEWERGMTNAAMTQFYIAASINPYDRQPYLAMADIFKRQGRSIDAVIVYSNFLRNNSNDVPARLELGELLLNMKMPAEAGPELEMVLKEDPDNTNALGDLAWTMATASNTTFRNGPRAVQLAERACGLTNYHDARLVGTLAAAYAEDGRFEDAVTTAQKAIVVAQQNHESDRVQANQTLLEMYRQHKPYHEVALVPAAN